MDEPFFVIYKTDTQWRLRSHLRSEALRFLEPFDNEEAVGYAVTTHTTDGGQFPMSEDMAVVKFNGLLKNSATLFILFLKQAVAKRISILVAGVTVYPDPGQLGVPYGHALFKGLPE
ncbi:MAG: hypothetical protein ACOCYO_11715 [Bacteroidota bacterium]